MSVVVKTTAPNKAYKGAVFVEINRLYLSPSKHLKFDSCSVIAFVIVTDNWNAL